MTVTRTTTTTTTVPNNETKGDQGLETTKTTTAAPPNELTTTPASVEWFARQPCLGLSATSWNASEFDYISCQQLLIEYSRR